MKYFSHIGDSDEFFRQKTGQLDPITISTETSYKDYFNFKDCNISQEGENR
ncbi:hypothetical protein VQ7734_01604 [Vibrio quintilis]|uniref:Uncharacterized protein n=1 Tax=Vibrio quintilis TaxID=1117707 RepID=A0A1M7YT78_9VIBR|nr:hypothetical protein VQ7734_01604 [Vibrio quintilis]